MHSIDLLILGQHVADLRDAIAVWIKDMNLIGNTAIRALNTIQ